MYTSTLVGVAILYEKFVCILFLLNVMYIEWFVLHSIALYKINTNVYYK